MASPTLVRALGLYLPVSVTWALWLWRRPSPAARAGILLALLWNVFGLFLTHGLAERLGWWRFEAEGGLFFGMPVDLYLGWVLLWGAIPELGFPRLHLVVLVACLVSLDLLLMPLAHPVLRLGPNWRFGEAFAVAVSLIPAQLLARWTREDRNLSARTFFQVMAFGGLILFVLPELIMEQTGGSWSVLLGRPFWITGLALQPLSLPAICGLTAVQEFMERGHGTPIPYDPPKRLVTSGVYAYVRNPMQIAASLVLVGWGLLVGSLWVAAAGIMAHIYSLGLAAWDEGEDLGGRFGAPWKDYRKAVRNWWPRWRPFVPLTARLYIAESCPYCSQFGQWLRRKSPMGLAITAAEEHPRRDLHRITYDPGDGSPEEEGVVALARGLEHVHLGWALLGWTIRLPFLRGFLQILGDASGAEPRVIARRPRGGSGFLEL